MKEKEIINFEDFGFSFNDDDELQKLKSDTSELEERLEKLYRVFSIFLDNLSKNPEQKNLVWPNRVEKINEFRQILLNIKEGKE